MSDQIQTDIIDTPAATASRRRQMAVVIILCGMALAAAIMKVMTWPLAVVLIIGMLCYTAKSVLKAAVDRLPIPEWAKKVIS